MARAYWTGQLQISLVSFGIQLFPATNPTGEISFHQIDRKSGKRVHHLNVIDDDTPVDRDEIVKGFEYRKGKYVVLEPDEVNKVRIESKRTIEVAQFVDLSALSPALFEKPYFVVPKEDSQAAAFAVVRKAMEETGKAAIGEIAFAGREHLMAITADTDKGAKGMMAYTLRYEEELRDKADYFGEIKSQNVDASQLKMAKTLIESFSGELDLSKFKDDYEAALRKLIDAKMKNKPLPVEEEPKKGKVIDLMEALRQSVAGQSGSGKSKADVGLKLVKSSSKKKKSA